MSNMIRIMVADDHDLYREVLIDFLKRNGFTVIGATGTGTELMQSFSSLSRSDIAIIGYKTSRPNGLEAIRWLRDRYPFVRILITILFNDKIPLEEFRLLGVEGIIIKSHADTQQIIKALQVIHTGGQYYSGDDQQADQGTVGQPN